MRNLLLCAALAACTSGSSSKGTLTATWSVKNIDGSVATCMAGYDTMKVSAFFHDADYDAADPATVPVVGLFPCDAGTGTLELQTDGTIDDETVNGKYDVEWDETDSTGDTAVVTDLQTELGYSVVADVSSGAATASTTLLQDGGYGFFSWTLFGKNAMDYLDSCTGAGVDKIDIELTDTMTTATTHLVFPCGTADETVSGVVGLPIDGIHTLGAGIAPLAAGYYTYAASAYAGTDVVGTSDPEDVTIDPRNKIAIFADGAEIELTNR